MTSYTIEMIDALADRVIAAQIEGEVEMEAEVKAIHDEHIAEYERTGADFKHNSHEKHLQRVRFACIKKTEGGLKPAFYVAVAALKQKYEACVEGLPAIKEIEIFTTQHFEPKFHQKHNEPHEKTIACMKDLAKCAKTEVGKELKKIFYQFGRYEWYDALNLGVVAPNLKNEMRGLEKTRDKICFTILSVQGVYNGIEKMAKVAVEFHLLPEAIFSLIFALTLRPCDAFPSNSNSFSDFEFNGWLAKHRNPTKSDKQKTDWNRVMLLEPEIVTALWDVIWEKQSEYNSNFLDSMNKPSTKDGISPLNRILEKHGILKHITPVENRLTHKIKKLVAYDLRKLSLKLFEHVHNCSGHDDKIVFACAQVKHDNSKITADYRASNVSEDAGEMDKKMNVMYSNGDLIIGAKAAKRKREAEEEPLRSAGIDRSLLAEILNKKRGRGGTSQIKAELKALIDS